jgi:hypothetical protein
MVQFYLLTTVVPNNPLGVGAILEQLVNNGSLVVSLQIDQLTAVRLTCGCPGNKIWLWTDNAPCPTEPCANGGRCGQLAAGQWYCHCLQDWTGTYCQAQQQAATIDLLPLIVLPIVLGLLMLILLLVCCCCFCCNQQRRQVKVIEEVVEQEEPQPQVKETHQDAVIYDEPIRQLPEQIYYHAIGRSFPVVFNDRTFDRNTTAASERYYGSLGKRLTVNFAGYNSIPGKPPSETGAVTSSRPVAISNYYNSLGKQQFPVAFNSQTFNRARNARSVLLTQPF